MCKHTPNVSTPTDAPQFVVKQFLKQEKRGCFTDISRSPVRFFSRYLDHRSLGRVLIVACVCVLHTNKLTNQHARYSSCACDVDSGSPGPRLGLTNQVFRQFVLGPVKCCVLPVSVRSVRALLVHFHQVIDNLSSHFARSASGAICNRPSVCAFGVLSCHLLTVWSALPITATLYGKQTFSGTLFGPSFCSIPSFRSSKRQRRSVARFDWCFPPFRLLIPCAFWSSWARSLRAHFVGFPVSSCLASRFRRVPPR